MSTHRLRRTETAQRLATPVSTPTSGSNTTLPRPYGSHTVSTPCIRSPTPRAAATAAAIVVVVLVVESTKQRRRRRWSFATWAAPRCNLFPHARLHICGIVDAVEMTRDVTRRLFADARDSARSRWLSVSVESHGTCNFHPYMSTSTRTAFLIRTVQYRGSICAMRPLSLYGYVERRCCLPMLIRVHTRDAIFPSIFIDAWRLHVLPLIR